MKRQVRPRQFEIDVLHVIREFMLIEPGSTVLLAVSGGADSMALMEVMHRLSPRRDTSWVLHVGHLHHGIRGLAANEDLQFVQTESERRGMAFHAHHADVPALAKTQGVSLETAARDVRHKFLLDVAESIGAQRIALAHHADDQAETVLFNMLRGAGLGGLAGMPIRRSAAAYSNVWLVRPLIDKHRKEIESYLTQCGLTYRVDDTNDDTRYTRNKLRHKVIPMLREINPAADDALLRLASQAAEAHNLIDRLARDILAEFSEDHPKLMQIRIRRAAFIEAPPIVQGSMLRQVITGLGVGLAEVSNERLSAALSTLEKPHGRRRVEFANGAWVERRADYIYLGAGNSQ